MTLKVAQSKFRGDIALVQKSQRSATWVCRVRVVVFLLINAL
jgi:hypothetical protein